MEREEVLKNYICMKYKSVRQFAIDKNLKYSTIASLLSHDLGKANIDTVFEICKALNISADALIMNGIIVEKPIDNKHIQNTRRIEAYALFIEIMHGARQFTIDDKLLTYEECRIFVAGIESLIDLIRRLRKDSEKEPNE